MATMNSQYSNPTAIAKIGETLYETLRGDLEATSVGKFVAINVKDGQYCVGDNPEEALQGAKNVCPDGLFHLIRIGFPGAFQISYAFQQTHPDWIFG